MEILILWSVYISLTIACIEHFISLDCVSSYGPLSLVIGLWLIATMWLLVITTGMIVEWRKT